MRVSYETDFANSPRLKKLVRKMKLPQAHAIGCCLEVWSACYVARSPFQSFDDIDAAAALDGFAQAMIDAELADVADAGDQVEVEVVLRQQPREVTIVTVTAVVDGVRVRGVAERISFLFKQRELSKLGVEARKARRGLRNQGKESSPNENPRVNPAVNPAVNPITLPLALTLPPATTRSPSLRSSTAARSRASSELGRDTSAAIAAFAGKYKRRYGASITATHKAAGQLKLLVKRHGLAEVERRMEILFTSPPAFLGKSAPDIGTLSQHFDKLVVGAVASPTSTARTEPHGVEAYEADAARVKNGGVPW